MRHFLLFISLSVITSAFSQAAGVLDARFISEKHYTFLDKIDIGGDVWHDLYNKHRKGELILDNGMDSLFNKAHSNGFYPHKFGFPYSELFHEDDHWAVRVYKTIDLETSCQGLFWDKGPARHKYTRESDGSTRTDTVYNYFGNSIFKDVVEKGIRKGYISVYLDIWYDQVFDKTYHPDTNIIDSLANLLPVVNKIIVKEDYFYDKYTGKTGAQIIAIGFYHDDQKLFWTYYPELSYSLRNNFLFHDPDINFPRNTTFDEVLKQQYYDIESISFEAHQVNAHLWNANHSSDGHLEHLTEMNARFYVKLIQSYIQANYRNFTGQIKMEVHDNLTLSTRLQSGQIQGLCQLLDEKNQPTLQIEFKNHIPNGTYTEFWHNGKVKEKGQFELGLKEGEWLNYFSNGKKMGLRNYERGWANGEQNLWYKNGEKFMSFVYQNFMLNGAYSRHNEKGELLESGEFADNYPDGNWKVNLHIPQEFVAVILANKDLDWDYPVEAFEDGILSYEVELEQGPKEKNCPSPIFKCVTQLSMSEVK